MKKITMCLVALTLTGCGMWDRTKAHYIGAADICHDGVMYVQFTSGASVKYDQNGKIVTCK